MAHPSPKRNMIPKAVLMRSGLVSLTTTRPVNSAQPRTIVNSARPMTNIFNKAHSTVRRPINNKTTTKNSNFNQKVNTARPKAVLNAVKGNQVNTARPKVVLNAVKGNQVNTARPKAVLNAVKGNQGNPQQDLQEKGVIDSGCSRHMTGNMSYLTDFEEIDGGYVAFGGNPKGGKITGRDDYSRFTWVFFLATKDETSGILKSFITRVENIIDQTVKVIRCDNGTEFKNKEMNQFCERKGNKREFSVARTPQQNRVAERRNRTLIEVARTMLADSKLPNTFWAEAVNTACYVQNRVLVVKPHNKIPYELFHSRTPTLSFMRSFGCPVTILNTIDYLGKFDGKDDEGFFVGYSINSKTFKVFNGRTRVVKENVHVQFSSKACDDVGKARMEIVPGKDYILLPLWTVDPPFSQNSMSSPGDGFKPSNDDKKKVDEDSRKENKFNVVGRKTNIELPHDPHMPELEDYSIFDSSNDDEDVGAEADMNNLDTTIQVSPTLATRIHKDHPLDQVIRDLQSVRQTRRMSKNLEEHGFVIHALKDPSWIEAMQEELLQFKLQEVWTLVDLPNGKRAIGTKWIFRNKKDKRGIVIRNKARLVAQGYTQEEGIDYDEVFAHVTRIEAIKLFLAYASFKDFVVYQMDVKSAFLYGKIEEEVYVCQPPGFEDPDFPDRVYKVEKALYGLHQAPRAWYETLSTYLLDNGFQRGKIDKTLFIMFWSTVKAKTVNGVVQLQALVDGKKIIVTEASIRSDLQLDDVEGMDCLPNAIIFEELTRMGYEKISQRLTFYKAFFSPQWKFLIHTILQCLSSKTTSWNKFSSIMASAIICLATNQKFNFSKYIFDSMVKNLENVSGKS
ncbi:putative ribonuclease H-like domain-containing protein [Tanacetum coccineum]